MTEQINVRLPSNLLKASKKYIEDFGYSNIQDLIKEALREKIYSLDYLRSRVKEAEKSKKYTRKDLGF